MRSALTTINVIATGIGDVPQWLADEGLERALAYFEQNDLDPAACHNAKIQAPHSELAGHWDKADLEANKVLLGDKRYEFSMINLEIEA